MCADFVFVFGGPLVKRENITFSYALKDEVKSD